MPHRPFAPSACKCATSVASSSRASRDSSRVARRRVGGGGGGGVGARHRPRRDRTRPRAQRVRHVRDARETTPSTPCVCPSGLANGASAARSARGAFRSPFPRRRQLFFERRAELVAQHEALLEVVGAAGGAHAVHQGRGVPGTPDARHPGPCAGSTPPRAAAARRPPGRKPRCRSARDTPSPAPSRRPALVPAGAESPSPGARREAFGDVGARHDAPRARLRVAGVRGGLEPCRRRAHAFSVNETCASSGQLDVCSAEQKPAPHTRIAGRRSRRWPWRRPCPCPPPRRAARAPRRRRGERLDGVQDDLLHAASASGRNAAICCRRGFTNRAKQVTRERRDFRVGVARAARVQERRQPGRSSADGMSRHRQVVPRARLQEHGRHQSVRRRRVRVRPKRRLGERRRRVRRQKSSPFHGSRQTAKSSPSGEAFAAPRAAVPSAPGLTAGSFAPSPSRCTAATAASTCCHGAPRESSSRRQKSGRQRVPHRAQRDGGRDARDGPEDDEEVPAELGGLGLRLAHARIGRVGEVYAGAPLVGEGAAEHARLGDRAQRRTRRVRVDAHDARRRLRTKKTTKHSPARPRPSAVSLHPRTPDRRCLGS